MIVCSQCGKGFEEKGFLTCDSMKDFRILLQPKYFKKINFSKKNGNPANLIFKEDEDLPFCGAKCSNENWKREKREMGIQA